MPAARTCWYGSRPAERATFDVVGEAGTANQVAHEDLSPLSHSANSLTQSVKPEYGRISSFVHPATPCGTETTA